MSSTNETVDRERGHHRAWMLLFAYGVIAVAVAFGLIAKGRPFDPLPFETLAHRSFDDMAVIEPKVFDLVTALFRLLGGVVLAVGLFVMAIAATGFREGRPWAWYVMWALPLEATIEFATFAGYGAVTNTQLIWALVRFATPLLALAISYRTFFPSAEHRGQARA